MTSQDTPATPDPGVYPGVSFDDYWKWDAANQSLLSRFARSAAHAREYQLHPPKRTPALDKGQATHTAILEGPDAFAATYLRAPDLARNTKKGREAWAAAEGANPTKILLPAGDFDAVLRMVRAIPEGSRAWDLLHGEKGANEVSLLWLDERTGLACKARLDRLTTFEAWPTVVDLKTTRNAADWAFSRSAHDYGMHIQAAHTLAGLRALGDEGASRRFFNVAVENEPPHAFVPYELDEEALDQGEREVRCYLRALAKCRETGEWPGYPDQVTSLSLPPYTLDAEALQ